MPDTEAIKRFESLISPPRSEWRDPGRYPFVNQVTDANRSWLRDWIIANDITLPKALELNDNSLHKAYFVGEPYLRALRASPLHGSGSRRPRGYKQSIALELSEEDKEFELNPIPETPKQSQSTPLQSTQLSPSEISGIAQSVFDRNQSAFEQKTKRAIETTFAEVLQNARLTDSLKQQIVAVVEGELLRRQTPRQLQITIKEKTKTLLAEPRHKAFDSIFTWLAMGFHVYCVGPAGTGKTHLFNQLSEALEKPLFPIGQSLTKYDLSGFKGPTGEYIGTLLRDAIEAGGLVAIDEGDTWAAAALAFLNTALANKYIAFPDKVITVHQDFQCIIAANTFGRGADPNYIGRNPLDGASLDRFAYEIVDYDEDLEKQLHGDTAWTRYVQNVRSAVMTLKLPHIVSMRATERCNVASQSNVFTPEQIAFANLWRGLDRDSVLKIKNLAGEPPRVLPSTTLHVVGEN